MIIELLTITIISTVIGTVIALYIWERKIRDRISVRRIFSPDDSDADMLLDLYNNLFPDDGTNYSSDEMIEILDGSPRFSRDHHVQTENIVLVAKWRGDVVGFLFCHYYPERRMAIISYYGINKKILEARLSATDKLLDQLKCILFDGRHSCDFLFFDVQGVDPSTPKEEVGERKARPRLFKSSVKRLGLMAHILQFPYTCPKVSIDHDTYEYPFSLICVPVIAQLPTPVPKSIILNFLHFIFYDCYGNLYPISNEKFRLHRNHLRQCIKHYEETLPPEVQVL